MIGHPLQQRLNGLDVIGKAPKVLECLAVGGANPGGQPSGENHERSAQQDDVGQLRMELRLVLLAARDEPDVGVFRGRQCRLPATSDGRPARIQTTRRRRR
jgi:hypothetical protein